MLGYLVRAVLTARHLVSFLEWFGHRRFHQAIKITKAKAIKLELTKEERAKEKVRDNQARLARWPDRCHPVPGQPEREAQSLRFWLRPVRLVAKVGLGVTGGPMFSVRCEVRQ